MPSSKPTVLHAWDHAGVTSLLIKQQRLDGRKADLMKRSGFDPTGIANYYGHTSYSYPIFERELFYIKVVLEASKYDIIHVHDLIKVIPWIRKFYGNKKKIILHYHGTFTRITPREKRANAEKLSDAVLVSTPDLLDFVDGIWLPNPVDVDLFHHREIPKNNKWLYIWSSGTMEWLENKLKESKYDMNYDILKRSTQSVTYEKMPELLSQYEYYIDTKYNEHDTKQFTYSMTGLQALSLGLKVLNYNNEIATSVPSKHLPQNVLQELNKIYES